MVGDMDLSEYAADWMQNPNRFLSDFVTQTREAGDLRRQQQREESTRGIEEWAASRGLTGSSLEGEQRIQLEQALDRNRAQEEQALTEALASYEAMDRLAAGEYGLDVFDATQRGTLAYDQMAHELALQGNELGQRESEFARNFGLDERQFSAQMDQFADQMALQREQMAQDNEHFSRALESEEARYAMDSDLRSRALDLQEQGMQMDEAFRQAQLEQDERLRTEALRLEERGMNLDDAYRYAALSQDDKFRTRALDLQKEGMDLDEAFRRAELDYRREAEERRDETTRRAILIDALKALHQVGGLGDVENLLDLIMGEGRPSNVTDDDDRPTGWQGPDDEDEDWRDDYPYEREGEEE